MASKKRPGISTIKKSLPQAKACCGAKRGHRPGCDTLATPGDGTPGASDLIDTVPESVQAATEKVIREAIAPNEDHWKHLIAAFRGIEEALTSLAETAKLSLATRTTADAPRPEKARKTKVEPAPEVEQPKPAPVAEKTAPKVEQPKTPPKQTLDMDEVRKVFLAFASRKGRDVAVGLLQKFGGTKLSEIPEAKLPAFFTALQAEG